jgi:hypothetical protein
LFGFGTGSKTKAEEGVVVVGENGRFWMHGRVIGGLLVAGESACVELQVKNHSSRKVRSRDFVMSVLLIQHYARIQDCQSRLIGHLCSLLPMPTRTRSPCISQIRF